MTMPATLETHRSFGIASTLQSNYPTLTQDLNVDVAIIGAGLVGITAATLLKKAGKKVAVLEAGQVGEGVSGHTTAKVTSLHHLIYSRLIDQIGQDKARLYGESNQAALEQIATLVQNEHIDCDGTLHQVSALCPHLGCIVDWDAAENSWNCPCHGSRFTPEGDILHGPAVNCLDSEQPCVPSR